MNNVDIFQYNEADILQDDYILLSELKVRAEKGTRRERELFLLAKDYLESICINNIGNNDFIYECNYTNRAELFVVELLGKERLSTDSIESISTRDLFLLCTSIRIRNGNKQVYECIKSNNPRFANKTDLWNDFVYICNRNLFNNYLEKDYLIEISESCSFVLDLLTIVDKAFSFLDQSWVYISDKENVDIEVIAENFIQFSAFCNDPNDFYLMMNHVNDFKQVLSTLYSKTENLKPCYKLQYHVLPTDKTIKYDRERYIIKPDLKITLNQINILNLLAGVNLYKDSYACLRELYQNSLDACRRRLCAKENNIDRGCIIFGMKVVDGKGKYIYCHDNGVGMDENVIENYLLRIGNSYYKSDEFQRERQQMNHEFTPVSQFGIGIISCFMLGTRIEIITKSIKPDSDYLYFCIGDIQGNIFYSRDITEEDRALVKNGGTMVRILLKEEFSSVLHTHSFNNIGFMQKLMTFPYKHANYKPYSYNKLQEWEKHLFTLISSFVCRPPENIDVFVELEKDLPIIKFPRQPYVLKEGELGVTHTDIDVFEKYYSRFGAKENIRNSCHTYYLDVIKVGGICFYPIVTLPIENIRIKDAQSTYVFRNIHIFNTVGNKIMTVDGIFVSVENSSLANFGLLDYTGEDMPKLSVDRKSVVSYPNGHYVKIQMIENIFRQQFRQLIAKHIKEHCLEKDKDTLYVIKLIGEEIGIYEQQFIFEGNIIFKLCFDSNDDIDLILCYESVTGELGCISHPCFGVEHKGSLNEFPFIKYQEDYVGADDAHVEQIEATSLSHIKTAAICLLDYGKLSNRELFDFYSIEGKLKITSDADLCDEIEYPICNSMEGDIYVCCKLFLENNQLYIQQEHKVFSIEEAVNNIPGLETLFTR